MPDLGQNLFRLVSCTPASGSVVSAGRPTFTLLFDEDVVDSCVWANNRQQIRMWIGSFRIPVRVSRSLGQRRKIFVTPLKWLPAQRNFTLAVSKDLVSASGCILGRTEIITFTTAKDRIPRPIPRPIPFPIPEE